MMTVDGEQLLDKLAEIIDKIPVPIEGEPGAEYDLGTRHGLGLAKDALVGLLFNRHSDPEEDDGK